jgi:hypothetical protein
VGSHPSGSDGHQPTGGTNTHTRAVYDDDGNVVTVYPPRAFSNSGLNPDGDYARHFTFDLDDRMTAQYAPRYDGGAASPQGPSGEQTAECPTNVCSGYICRHRRQQPSGSSA